MRDAITGTAERPDKASLEKELVDLRVELMDEGCQSGDDRVR